MSTGRGRVEFNCVHGIRHYVDLDIQAAEEPAVSVPAPAAAPAPAEVPAVPAGEPPNLQTGSDGVAGAGGGPTTAANNFIGEEATFIELLEQVRKGWLLRASAKAIAMDLNIKANSAMYAVSQRADGMYTLYQTNSQGIGGMGAGDQHVWSDERTFTQPEDTVDRTPPPDDPSVSARRQ